MLLPNLAITLEFALLATLTKYLLAGQENEPVPQPGVGKVLFPNVIKILGLVIMSFIK